MALVVRHPRQHVAQHVPRVLGAVHVLGADGERAALAQLVGAREHAAPVRGRLERPAGPQHVAVQQGNDTIQKLEGEIRTKIAPLSDKVCPATLP